jgi:anti-sigma regulatory factor (Ser/Thr protein kinase)
MEFVAEPDAGAPIVRDIELLAHRSELALARRYTAQVAGEFGLDNARTTELVYAVNEAVTNAIRHGMPDSAGRIRVGFVATADCLTFKISDYGTFVMPLGDPGADAGHGRGFQLMSRLADRVWLYAGPSGTTVMLAKELS